MNKWLENLLGKMTKWFFVNDLILKLDIISLLIDGLFYKALSEAPQAILNRADANALKIPVLVFVVFGMHYTTYKHLVFYLHIFDTRFI